MGRVVIINKLVNSISSRPWHFKFKNLNHFIITVIIRIRTSHCLTKEHLHKINVLDHPFCTCEEIVNFFFECRNCRDNVIYFIVS